MNTKTVRCATVLGAALASLGWSQVETQQLVREGPPPIGDAAKMFAEGVAPAFRVFGVGGIEGKTVSGAPYSADQTTQTTQTLADGNRIVNTSKSKVYRDAQGRERVEQTLGNIGGLAAAQPQTMIMIDDPVANVHYTLHPDTRTAEKMETNSTKVTSSENGMVMKREAELSLHVNHITGPSTAEGFSITSAPALPASSASRAEEDLGTQNMEGLMAQGKRSTTTIPAGAMGNERPIQIVDERWYSPELQMNVMTKHSDPRMGETVFTVTGVNRANPDPSLFQLPADFQVTDSHNMIFKFKKVATP